MAQTVAYQRARVLEADGAIAGSSRQHQDYQDYQDRTLVDL